ncbi:MAG TPA: Ig-like domain-containing protein [Chthonomonadaceae bacterium]|nr:Ig-like domain-containing protein [Chthonomonadaceae bacterium]
MRKRTIILSVLLLLMLGVFPLCTGARGISTLRLRATRTTILADGKQFTDIIAEMRDSSGRPVGANVSVQFSATAGQLSSTQAFTNSSGEARVRLTSAPVAGTSHIQAFSPGATPDTIDIEFTDDPEATFNGNNYMEFTGTSYLAYSATDRIVAAEGKDGGGKLAYRNIQISADRLQYRCNDNIVRAFNNVTIKRGADVVKAVRLYYSLQNAQGFALAEDEKGQLQTYKLIGEHLRRELSPVSAPGSYLTMPDFQRKLVIVARSITYFPGDRLQFRRPKFYQDTVQVMSLPFYQLSLNSEELFSDQFFSIGTSGLGLTLPFYYALTPKQAGTITLYHQQQLGRGYFATQPGWGIDVVQAYSSQGEQRYEGAFGLYDLTRGDWSARFTHSHEFNSETSGSFYLDFPHHDSLFSAMDIGQQLKTIRWGANVSGGQTLISPITSSFQSQFFVETQPRRFVGSKDLMWTVGTNVNNTVSHSETLLNGLGSQTYQSVTFRTFTRPIAIDQHTTLSNSMSLGQVWGGSNGSGGSALLTTSLDRTLKGGGSLNLTYDYVSQPTGLFLSSGKHRLSGAFNYMGIKRLQMSVIGSTLLDANESSLLADVAYRLDSHWRLLGSATLDRADGQSYTDFEFTVGRRIGAREFQLTYSTLLRRISFDMTATRF